MLAAWRHPQAVLDFFAKKRAYAGFHAIMENPQPTTVTFIPWTPPNGLTGPECAGHPLQALRSQSAAAELVSRKGKARLVTRQRKIAPSQVIHSLLQALGHAPPCSGTLGMTGSWPGQPISVAAVLASGTIRCTGTTKETAKRMLKYC